MNEVQQSNLYQLEAEITVLKHQTAQNIIEIGKRLIQAKELVPHGEWGRWLEEKVDISQWTANRFMKVAKEFSNYGSINNLSQTKIFALLEVPKEERETFIEENPVEDLTTRELAKAIKEKKELEERAIKAEKEVEELKNQEPTVIETEVEKTVLVVPEDYDRLKLAEKRLEQQIQNLENSMKGKVSPEDYNKIRKEYSEKVNENHELKKQIEQLVQVDSKAKHQEKLKDSALIFCTRIHTFLNDVGGLAWLTDYLDELDDYDKRSYYKQIHTFI